MHARTLLPLLSAFAGLSRAERPQHTARGVQTTASVSGIPVFPVINYGLLCELSFLEDICARILAPSRQVVTPLGLAQGVSDGAGSGVNRFVVKYASASRWAAPTVTTQWQLPNGSRNASALPLACPQDNVDPSSYTEDCLSIILFVPTALLPSSNVPTLMWIHGGSFITGSATNPGLDGSKLAVATNSIVAVIQYRLGALGFMAPSGATNLGLQDTIAAMKFLAKVVPSFGGNAKKITVAGQSSGAGMIRALLATPSASSLFQSAILQSDPMNYGFLNASTQTLLQQTYNSLINCSPTDVKCQNALAIQDILDAQDTLSNESVVLDASTGIAEPIRPVRDGALITTPLDSTAPFPAVTKPILLTNVRNEAGPTIYLQFQAVTPEVAFQPTLSALLGPSRAATIDASGFYNTSVDDARQPLESMGTDYMWRCPTWTFARNWVGHGGKAFVGLYMTGATYPFNADVPFCLEPGSVCHQDDIEIVFGTVPSPSPAQAALTAEMQARYKAFLNTGSPNVKGLMPWTAATTGNVHAHQLGGLPSPSGEIAPGACDPAFWGAAVPYDYQVFGI
ncbi:unnamed protein product [Mycena citricolor]|uniref:Carboxylic ester hydrolase n=1 Tax=Mycena citricolor TaxID=2018698 RepID=A0AAD2HKU3_9AGAR|nr:unnamed protein product [Mycena citricolor]